MRKVAVIGCGFTKFGRREESVVDLLAEASLMAMRDAGVEGEIDAVFVANMSSGEFEGLSGIANALVSQLSLEPAAAMKIENTSGSGGSAVYAGWLAIASGQAELALVAGGEKMTSKTTEEVSEVIASLTPHDEWVQGVTLPSFAGLAARYYMSKHGATREALAAIAVKNHRNGVLNPYAQFQREITIDEVLTSPIVADPLRLYDFCPITDGASAVILTTLERAKGMVDRPVVISGLGFATDTHSIQDRESLDELKAVKLAAEKAYRMSGRKPTDIQVVEVHDMATIMEVMQLEELGLFPKGQAWRSAEDGITTLDGRLPVNTSGGLKAKGHPIGATGVAQVAEITMQIQRRCGKRQVEADIGLTCNVAGFGNGAVVMVLEGV